MKISKLIGEVVNLIRSGNVPFVQGPPGIGKTDLHCEAAARLKMDYLPLYTASYLPEHFGGYPFKSKDGADFLPLGFLRQIVEAKRPLLVFLDEVDKCGQGLQNAIAQMVQGRKVGQQVVPDCVCFSLAGNRPEDRAGGVRIVKHLVERCIMLTLEVDPGDWQEWALAHAIDPMIRAHISRRPEGLLDFDPNREGSQTNPRKWEKLSAFLQVEAEPSVETLRGFLAERQAVEFSQFKRLVAELEPYEAIVASPDTCKVPERGDCQYAVAAMLAQMAKPEDAEAVAVYAARLPAEIAGFAFHSLAKRDKDFARNSAFIGWALKVGVNLR